MTPTPRQRPLYEWEVESQKAALRKAVLLGVAIGTIIGFVSAMLLFK